VLRVGVASLVLAALSALVWPPAPVFDPYGWAVWGREIAALDLHTGAALSWKPLPSFVCALLSPLGDAMPQVWVLIARAGFVAMVILAARLALRFEPTGGRTERVAAAGLAAASTLLIADLITPLPRQFNGGLSEPMTAAFFLFALDRALTGRARAAMAGLFLAGLMRPESLVVMAAYGLLLARRPESIGARDVEARSGIRLGAVLFVSAIALWTIPDYLGSGSIFTGPEQAQVEDPPLPSEGLEALWRFLYGPMTVMWAGVAWLLVEARRRGDRAPAWTLASAIVWTLTVAAMALGGYAGLPRFLLPAIAAACVLGAAGLVGAASALLGARGPSARLPRPVAVGAVVLASASILVQAFVRLEEYPGDFELARERAEAVRDIDDLIERVGRDRLLACEEVDFVDPLARTTLAWHLDVRIGRVTPLSDERDETSRLVVVGPDVAPALRDQLGGGRLIGRAGEWGAYEYDCDSASRELSAGSAVHWLGSPNG
jgi:hypothetical protein